MYYICHKALHVVKLVANNCPIYRTILFEKFLPNSIGLCSQCVHIYVHLGSPEKEGRNYRGRLDRWVRPGHDKVKSRAFVELRKQQREKGGGGARGIEAGS